MVLALDSEIFLYLSLSLSVFFFHKSSIVRALKYDNVYFACLCLLLWLWAHAPVEQAKVSEALKHV